MTLIFLKLFGSVTLTKPEGLAERHQTVCSWLGSGVQKACSSTQLLKFLRLSILGQQACVRVACQLFKDIDNVHLHKWVTEGLNLRCLHAYSHGIKLIALLLAEKKEGRSILLAYSYTVLGFLQTIVHDGTLRAQSTCTMVNVSTPCLDSYLINSKCTQGLCKSIYGDLQRTCTNRTTRRKLRSARLLCKTHGETDFKPTLQQSENDFVKLRTGNYTARQIHISLYAVYNYILLIQQNLV